MNGKKIRPLLFLVLFLMISIQLFNLFSISSGLQLTQARIEKQTTPYLVNNGEILHQEEYVDTGYSSLGTGDFSVGTVIRVNYTVLPCSNSSVKFRFHYDRLDYDTWLPTPQNYTLDVGESFAGEFTLERTIGQVTDIFIYEANVVAGGTNATMHWWYEVLVTRKISATSFMIVSTTLFVITVISAFHSKRKQQTKGQRK